MEGAYFEGHREQAHYAGASMRLFPSIERDYRWLSRSIMRPVSEESVNEWLPSVGMRSAERPIVLLMKAEVCRLAMELTLISRNLSR